MATPSPNLPGDERAVAGLVTEALAERGLPAPTVLAKESHRPNLVVTLDFGPGGRTLCLSGHLDTKPVGAAVWRTDPLTPTVDGDRLYGLGTCDMKGAVAAMIEAAAAAAAAGLRRGRLSLLFTADEENAAAYGARFLAENDAVDADAVLIGEPGGIEHDWDTLHLVSRGITNFTVDVRGDQGHSSLTDRRPMTSATHEMARLLLAFADGFSPSAPTHPLLPGGATVNAGVLVSGGVGFGVSPGLASFAVDVRLMPGMDQETFTAELQAFLDAAAAARPTLRASVRFEDPPRDWLPPTEVPTDHPLVAATSSALGEVLGNAPPASVFPGTTDAAWLQGLAGIPTLPACGPGLLSSAHGADEYVRIPALGEAYEVYRRVIARYCPEQDDG
ncbi:MAG: M20 family metallopeptidase [Egibacteraceae bacterium]